MLQQFTCENCNRSFMDSTSDEEAFDEARTLFGSNVKDLAIVCEECFDKIFATTVASN